VNQSQSYRVNPGWALLLNDLGLNTTNVLRRAGLPPDMLAREHASITPDQYYGLWRAIEEEADDPLLPIHVGQAISVEAFDPPIFAALCSRNLNVAAERVSTYKKLIGPMRLVVTANDHRTTLELQWPRMTIPPASLSTAELVFWVALARIATRADVPALGVTSPYLPADAHAYREYLGVSITWSPEYTVSFSAREASRPFVTANEPMWESFEPALRTRLSQLEAGATMTGRVHSALLELLPAGSGTVQAVARELAVSTRTLQRQLRSEDTSFQSVLNDTRESLARHYLAQGHLSTPEIAFLVGYEEPSSFYRAFHGWTGQTPQRVRLAAV
jgi:AraC-like DNA-binding protein